MDNSYFDQRQWSDATIPQGALLILDRLKSSNWDIVEAPAEVDMQQATDLILFNDEESYTIAYRTRREQYMYDYPYEFTVRLLNKRGMKTEYAKITADGFAEMMFYGFLKNGRIIRWVLIDLNIFRDNHVKVAPGQYEPKEHIEYQDKHNQEATDTDLRAYNIKSFPREMIIACSPGYFEDVEIERELLLDNGKKRIMYKFKPVNERLDRI